MRINCSCLAAKLIMYHKYLDCDTVFASEHHRKKAIKMLFNVEFQLQSDGKKSVALTSLDFHTFTQNAQQFNEQLGSLFHKLRKKKRPGVNSRC